MLNTFPTFQNKSTEGRAATKWHTCPHLGVPKGVWGCGKFFKTTDGNFKLIIALADICAKTIFLNTLTDYFSCQS